ncbi:trimethyllysine dioxygenase, mitochondrial-like [Scaptodrosophila lebanonensis]|uniref:Trimethyllysine dioxygenase, mitochondrial n=1 Tax=Drosophila lebanonensis TaxID=7225 RepID=A0A6J2TM74_DROLE|nr:trimethyllysine dioxygenase, mitochondrial-like [Scaptodrosophila lebanonensis]
MISLKHPKTGKILEVDEFWLRYHCRCVECVDADTKQRRYNLFDLPAAVKALKLSYKSDQALLLVEWSDGHKANYDIDNIYNSQLDALISRRTSSTIYTPWNRSTILKHEQNLCFSLSALINNDDVVKSLVTSLVRYGIAFINEVPPTPTMTELAIRRVFPIMKTFFGELWTFGDRKDHADTAYTKLYLGSHTDNTYFCDAAGLQALHCIEHVNGEGGENFFVDGLHVVQELKRENPKAYELLCRVQVPAEYIEPGQHHRHTAPIIKTDPVTGEFVQIRVNEYDRAIMDTLPQSEMANFHGSLRALLELIREEANQWQLKLSPGTIVIFDNWRVLHGRMAYTGQRTMSGAYVQRTDFVSKARVLGIIE